MATINDLQTTSTGVQSRTIINDNFDELNTEKVERDGTIPMTGKLTFSGTDHAGIRLQNLTTAQRDALTPQAGDAIFNTTTSQEETYNGTSWVAPTGTSDASTTVKGVSEEATEAEVVAGTAAGGTGARLFVNPSSISDKLLTADERTLVRDVEGTTTATEINQLAGTTNIAEANTFFGATDLSGAEAETLSDGSNADSLHVHTLGGMSAVATGQSSRAINSTGTQAIAHGLSGTPSLIIIQAFAVTDNNTVASESSSYGTATSTSDETSTFRAVRASSSEAVGQDSTHIISLQSSAGDAGTPVATATLSSLDATNITLNWDVNANQGSTRYFQWTAFL